MRKWIEKCKNYLQNADEKTKKKRLISALCVLAFFAATLVLCFTVGGQIVRFASDAEGFRAWVDSHGLLGKAAYIGIVFLQIVVAFIPGEPIELVGGYAFGAWQGLLLAEIGMLLGSTAVFLFVKRFGVKAVEAFVSREKLDSLSFLKNSEKRNLIVFLLFFIPGTPKDVLTYFAGLTPMKLGEWLLITSVARIPSVISSTLAGAAVGDANYKVAIIVYGATAIASVVGGFAYKRYTAKKQGGGAKKC